MLQYMQAAILVPALRPALNPQFPALHKWYEAMKTPALQENTAALIKP